MREEVHGRDLTGTEAVEREVEVAPPAAGRRRARDAEEEDRQVLDRTSLRTSPLAWARRAARRRVVALVARLLQRRALEDLAVDESQKPRSAMWISAAADHELAQARGLARELA